VIVASGTSNRQTKALAASVRDKVREAGFPKPRIEGEENGEWIIVDCGAAVAHVMQPTIRTYYNLEEIWGDKPVRLKFGAARPLVKAEVPAEKKAATRPARSGAPAPEKAAGKTPSKAPAKPAARRPASAASPTRRKAVETVKSGEKRLIQRQTAIGRYKNSSDQSGGPGCRQARVGQEGAGQERCGQAGSRQEAGFRQGLILTHHEAADRGRRAARARLGADSLG
jgi:hypothetical protein